MRARSVEDQEVLLGDTGQSTRQLGQGDVLSAADVEVVELLLGTHVDERDRLLLFEERIDLLDRYVLLGNLGVVCGGRAHPEERGRDETRSEEAAHG